MEIITPRSQNIKIAKKLTRRLLIDIDGNIHIWFQRKNKLAHYEFDDIEKAISQNIHILEKYIDFTRVLNSEEIQFTGELEFTKDLLQKLQNFLVILITRLSQTNNLEQNTISGLQAYLKEIDQDFSKSKNTLKKLIESKGKNICKISQENYQSKMADIVTISTDLLQLNIIFIKRLIEIVQITKATFFRLDKLLKEKSKAEMRIINIYNNLLLLVNRIKQSNDDYQIEKYVNQIINQKLGLLNGLNIIIVNPYKSILRLPEIQKLYKLKKYINDRHELIRIIIGATSRLDRFVREYKNRQHKHFKLEEVLII